MFEDFLGPAAVHKRAAEQAAKSGNFDVAWREVHNQQSCYIQHAKSHSFDRAAALRITGSVHEDLADILRLEGKHDQALAHFIYFAATQGRYFGKTKNKKLTAYKSRARIPAVTMADVSRFIKELRMAPDFRSAQNQVGAWVAEA